MGCLGVPSRPGDPVAPTKPIHNTSIDWGVALSPHQRPDRYSNPVALHSVALFWFQNWFTAKCAKNLKPDLTLCLPILVPGQEEWNPGTLQIGPHQVSLVGAARLRCDSCLRSFALQNVARFVHTGCSDLQKRYRVYAPPIDPDQVANQWQVLSSTWGSVSRVFC